MDQHDYFAPVRYEPPTGPRGSPLRLVLICAAIAAVLLLAGYFLRPLLMSKEQRLVSKMFPKAGVRLGQPLQWRRVLDYQKLSRAQGPGAADPATGLDGPPSPPLAGNFDSDADQELLFLSNDLNHFSLIMDADGAWRTAPLDVQRFVYDAVAWDYDRDGIDEIVVEQPFSEQVDEESIEPMKGAKYLDVFSVTGALAGKIKSSKSIAAGFVAGDINGDRYAELVVFHKDKPSWCETGKLKAYGKNGEEVWSETATLTYAAFMDAPIVLGDIDGDGQAEILCLQAGQPKLQVHGVEQDPQPLRAWPAEQDPACCADVNGDGAAEIIAASGGLLDPVTESWTPFNIPDSFKPVATAAKDVAFHTTESFSHALVYDIDQDGTSDVLVSGILLGCILAFNPSGKCVYYEEFNTIMGDITSVTTSEQTHLAMENANGVYLYP